MKKRFLGIICLLYSFIIVFVWFNNYLNNFISPRMQIYLKLSIIPFILMGLVFLFSKHINYRFKISDLILILPLIMLIIAGDGRLSMNLAGNRLSSFASDKRNTSTVTDKNETENNKEESPEAKEDNMQTEEEQPKQDLSDIYFEIVDKNYSELSDYLTYSPNASKYEGYTIKVRGFTLKKDDFIPEDYFAFGKYTVNCCTADAEFMGFFAKYDMKKIKNNKWYEIEGVLKKGKDTFDYDIMYIEVINIKEINSKSEEQYVYPCYTYDDGLCTEVSKYNLEY